MDEIVYIIGAVISVAWSLWLYTIWERKGLGEASPFRFVLLFFPATTFFLIAMSGWSSVFFLRMDILGLLLFFLLITGTWLFQFITLPLSPDMYKNLYRVSLIVNICGSLGIAGFVYIVKLYPMAGISLFAFFKSFEKSRSLALFWHLMNPETNKQDTFSAMNRLLIALCSYLPLTLVRMWYTNRKFKVLKREIDEIKTDLSRVIKRISTPITGKDE